MSAGEQPDDTEDKLAWCEYGSDAEQEFVEEIAPELGLDVRMNPEKEHDDYAHDIIVEGFDGDLKHQTEPFYKSEEKYGFTPSMTVTFNENDFKRYNATHDELAILFWVDFDGGEDYGVEVEENRGIWRVYLSEITEWVLNDEVPIHSYKNRYGDRQNARHSYLLDLGRMEQLR